MSVSSSKTIFFSLVLLISLGFIWGSGYAIARYVEMRGISILNYTFWQAIGPAVLCLFLLFLRKENWRDFFRHWQYFLVTAVLGIVIPNTNMYALAIHVPSNILAIVINISPILIYPLALIFHQEKFHWFRLLGIFVGVFGVMFVILSRAAFFGMHETNWLWLSFLTPISFAFCAVYIAACRPKGIDSLSLSAGMLLMSTLILMPIVFIFQPHASIALPFNWIGGWVLIRILLSTAGYVFLFMLLKLAGPVYYSLVDSIVILTGVFWGWVVFGERLNGQLMLAVGLIILAIVLMSWSNQYRLAVKKGE